ncbi:PLIN3 protein, partial [Amia calva]|nr:PLIN3 protein [Amia calva]
QSALSRVAGLPLVSSAVGAVSGAYSSTKDSVPYLRGVVEAAESGMRSLGSAAAAGTRPLLDRLEPHMALVNEYACVGLDKLEQKLPILQTPADKVVSNTCEMVCGVRDSVSQSVSGVTGAVTGAMTGAVSGAMERTRAAVSGGVSSMLGTRVGQMVVSGVDMALSHSEAWVEQHLPLSEKELAALSEPVSGEEAVVAAGSVSGSAGGQQSYFVRLGALSTRLRDHALEQSLGRARQARQDAHAALAQLSTTLDLVERTRAQLAGAPEQLLQRWAEWREGQPAEPPVEQQGTEQEQLEWRALTMARALSAQLGGALGGVVSSVQGLPGGVQGQLAAARRGAAELQASLGGASSLSGPLLEQSRAHVAQVRQSLDGAVEYLLNNTPLNWLVGPFAPQITERADGAGAGKEGAKGK